MYSAEPNNKSVNSQVPNWAPRVVAPPIDAGAKKLEPPNIIDIGIARQEKVDQNSITQWNTPYNRPSYKSEEHVGYTKAAFQYFQQGRLEDAERLFLKAHDIIRSAASKDITALLESIENLAFIYFNSHKYLTAEPYVCELVINRVRMHSPSDKILVSNIDQLAYIYEKTGRKRDAMVLYRFLLAVQEDRFGRRSLEVCPTLNKLSEAYLKIGNLVAAEGLLLRMLSIYQPVYGLSSLEVSSLLDKLANVYKLQNRFDKAAAMLQRQLHILESIHGDNGLAVASCLLKLAHLLSQLKMAAEAEPLYRRVCSIYESRYGKQTAETSVNRRKTQSELPNYGDDLPFTISFIDSRSTSKTKMPHSERELAISLSEKYS